MDVKNTWLCHP
jgi:hypothetical protein